MWGQLFLGCAALSHTLPSPGAVSEVPVGCSAVTVQGPAVPQGAAMLCSYSAVPLCPQSQGLLILAVPFPLP